MSGRLHTLCEPVSESLAGMVPGPGGAAGDRTILIDGLLVSAANGSTVNNPSRVHL